jgi:chromosome segregation ATPase
MECTTPAGQAAIEALRDATDQAAKALYQSSVEQSSLRLRIAELEAENARLADELGDAQTEVKILTQDQELLQKELALEKSSNQRLQEEIDMPLRQSTSTDEELDDAKIEIEKLKSEVSELQDELSHLELVEELLEESRATVNQLDEEIADLKEQHLQDSKVNTELVSLNYLSYLTLVPGLLQCTIAPGTIHS